MQSIIAADLPLSKLAANHVRTRSVTANTAVSDADGVVYVNASGGSVTVTLPPAANRAGHTVTIVRTDATPANSVTISPLLATNTINGNSSLVLSAQNAVAVLQSNGASLWNIAAQAPMAQNGAMGLYGNGGDGALLYNGSSSVLGVSPSSSTYTLNRDIYGTTITINTGVTIVTAGFRIFASVAILNSGTISCTGGAGGNGSSGTPGAAGAASATGTLGAGGVGKAGVSGNTAGTAGTSVTAALGGAGGAGGSATNAGGTAGTVTNPTAAQGGAQALQCVVSALHGRANDNTQVLGGASGGSGAGSASGDEGGGSGAGGGIVLLSSPVIAVLSGATVTAAGGNGGNGFASSGAAGGGGGGGGGVIVLVYNGASGYSNAGTVSVAGGTGGAHGSSGGNAGSNGSAGTIIQIQN